MPEWKPNSGFYCMIDDVDSYLSVTTPGRITHLIAKSLGYSVKRGIETKMHHKNLLDALGTNGSN